MEGTRRARVQLKQMYFQNLEQFITRNNYKSNKRNRQMTWVNNRLTPN